MNNQEINQLARAAKEGDSGAFGQLFDELSDSVYRFLTFRLRDDEQAKDLLSQIWLEAWQSLRRYNPDRSFRTWLFAIARYNLIDHYRRYRPTVSLDAVINRSGSTDIEAEVELADEMARVVDNIDQLPELYQTVLKLKFVEELEYPEIAEITGKTENHLRVIVKRGLDKLRANYEA
ncbi:MAG: RNA polymerase sigma factor RNA polymerase sigma-70 factor, ECF subfamily [candidate division Kazan bacterium GW2011_GWA1_50_15]|uniref:RNA polymerase sigma factor SigW n=2 Tax=Bacteria division Kazan-3B-28 TaxID=1798534 RepID=A0A0G1X7J6_UNCK3|nr:MAG: RNA polymerase sigma factor RNA polymerase sigma-70 factor, ECF subfamily [candidate division Kazan bacterium GW2011_GWA1_50_15]KKW25858.1 MAG: RNA polymerase sigma factor SigW [candidate division Kazan bacterium GW2011_GWC1_52_13]KKW27128.1 MAG: RNA polymerase sigma factor SigW [candidate division Kazan bacterium GW2011_GWB1_52_7]HCR42416.1 hypothetical protein [Patescibacteria group bacterium]